jgi:hypothetical protein
MGSPVVQEELVLAVLVVYQVTFVENLGEPEMIVLANLQGFDVTLKINVRQ